MPLHPSIPIDGLQDIDAYAASHGLDMNLRLGFDGFASFPIDRGGHPVFAGFLPPRDGFWIAVTLDGRPFATYAAMPMDPAESLSEHFEIDGLYPGDDRWEIVDPDTRALCNTIRTTTMFGGGIVVDIRHRRTERSRRMMTLLPLAGRILGHALYGAEHFVYLQPASRSFSARTDNGFMRPLAVRWTRNGEDLGAPRTFGHASWDHVGESLLAFRRATAPTP